MRNGGAVNDATTGETVSEWYQRYFDWRKARAMGAETAEESRGRVRKWIKKKFGARAIRSITRDDLERFASFLDEQVNATVIASKTATNLWCEITVAFAFATKGKNKFGKNLGLRVLDVNPADGAAGPESGVSKQKTFLRPDEVTKLCPRRTSRSSGGRSTLSDELLGGSIPVPPLFHRGFWGNSQPRNRYSTNTVGAQYDVLRLPGGR